MTGRQPAQPPIFFGVCVCVYFIFVSLRFARVSLFFYRHHVADSRSLFRTVRRPASPQLSPTRLAHCLAIKCVTIIVMRVLVCAVLLYASRSQWGAGVGFIGTALLSVINNRSAISVGEHVLRVVTTAPPVGAGWGGALRLPHGAYLPIKLAAVAAGRHRESEEAKVSRKQNAERMKAGEVSVGITTNGTAAVREWIRRGARPIV